MKIIIAQTVTDIPGVLDYLGTLQPSLIAFSIGLLLFVIGGRLIYKIGK